MIGLFVSLFKVDFFSPNLQGLILLGRLVVNNHGWLVCHSKDRVDLVINGGCNPLN